MTASNTRRIGFYNTAAAAEHYLGIRWPRAIWQAVLEQAITDVVEGAPQYELQGMTRDAAIEYDAALRAAASDWIADEGTEPRRFVWVCEVLDLDPAAVRQSIERRLA